MPKPKPSKKIIRQENLWPTPYWYTTIWEFMRSKTRVTFNEDFTNYILNEAENKESVRKSNRGGWQSELISATNENVTARYEVICIVEASSIRRINKPPKLKKNPAAIKHIAPKISLLNFIFIYFVIYLN